MISESDAMRMTRRNFLVSTAAAMAWPMGPAAAGTVGIGGPAFGSTWRAALPDQTDSVAVRKLVAAVVNEINQAMSPYLEQSELSVFNRTETVDWQNCSTPLADVAGHALEISRQTEGAFDPTIGPLVNRFGFGPIHGERVHPADLSVSVERIAQAIARPDAGSVRDRQGLCARPDHRGAAGCRGGFGDV
jgi:thiamine biosynthesis lipoprotein